MCFGRSAATASPHWAMMIILPISAGSAWRHSNWSIRFSGQLMAQTARSLSARRVTFSLIPLSFGLYPGGPWANGSVFLSPQAGLPTVTAAGTYDVPFNVGGSFCVTDNPDFRAPQTVVFPSQELLLLTIR